MPAFVAALMAVALLSNGSQELPPESDSPIAWTEHRADVTFVEGLAHFTVTRAFENTSARPLELDVKLPLPEAGVVRELQIERQGTWADAELLDGSVADARYARLKSAGGQSRQPVVILSHEPEGEVRLRALPLFPRQPLRVRYTVAAPVFYANGHWVARSAYRFVENPDERSFREAVQDDVPCKLSSRQPGVKLTPGGEEARLEATPFDGVLARIATARLRSGEHAVRLELAMVPKLSVQPEHATVVFLLDASASEGEIGVQGQLEVIAAYLERLPDSAVEAVVFRRRAARLFGTFLGAGEARKRLLQLPRGALAPGNGSAVDEGLELASRLLAGRSGPSRVVVLSDGLYRDAFSPARAQVHWPAQTVVHVGLMRVSWTWRHSSWAYLEGLKGGHPLAPLAEPTGGIVLALNPPGPERPDREVEELIRPTRLEAPKLVRLDGAVEDERLPDSLEEGSGFTRWSSLPNEPGPLLLEGRLWSRAVRWPLTWDAPLSARLPELIVNAPPEAPFSADDRTTAAREAKVLGPGLAFFSAPPGKTPRRAFLPELEIRGGGRAGLSCGGGDPPPGNAAPEAPQWLAAALARHATACASKEGHSAPTTLRIETTGREIVDVAQQGDPSAFGTCLVEAAWGVMLDERFTEEHGRYTVRVPGEPH